MAPILLAYSLEFETSASVCYLFLLFSAVLAVLVFLQQRRNLLQQNPVCAGTAMCDAISAARLVLPSQSDRNLLAAAALGRAALSSQYDTLSSFLLSLSNLNYFLLLLLDHYLFRL